ncbi:Valacyclovir hydrolase [Blattella germanica]|nr:Valacyclovir hydrolase [Blattella germanica]
MVIMEQPGYGRSRPPDRNFSSDMLYKDAELAAKLMQELNFQKYSVLGWSFGGVVGMIMAANYPEQVEKLVAWGSATYISKAEMKIYEHISDINNLSPLMQHRFINYYGREYFQRSWTKLLETLTAIYKEQEGELCNESVLNRISCPTLILHGTHDIMLSPEHPAYIKKHIKNCRLHMIEEGKHNIQEQYSQEFNRVVDEFLRKSE